MTNFAPKSQAGKMLVAGMLSVSSYKVRDSLVTPSLEILLGIWITLFISLELYHWYAQRKSTWISYILVILSFFGIILFLATIRHNAAALALYVKHNLTVLEIHVIYFLGAPLWMGPADFVNAGPAAGPAPEAPLQEIDQDLIWENLDAQEQEARAREHARIYGAVEAITEACEKKEAAMIDKAHILLHQKGITLEDPRDVRRALEAALYDDWQHDIDDRLPHFRGLKLDFGTAHCSIWNKFIDELRDLGNPQVNARHKVD